MTDLTQNSNLDDEVLSAYIDGELTDAERASVEARLATDSTAREWVAEMRSLSGALKSIPKENLTEDFRAAVLSQIGDRQVSLPPAKLTTVRRLMWPAIAIAAALMLMFIQDDQNREVDKVAKVEAGAAERRDRELASQPGAAFEAPAEEPITLEAPARRVAPAPTMGDHLSTAGSDPLPAESAAATVVSGEAEGAAIAARRMTEAIEASDAELEGVVHLTLTDFREGSERFNRLLLSNGVQLVDEPPVPPPSAATPASAASPIDSYAARPDVGAMSTRSGVPSAGLGGVISDASDGDRSSSSESMPSEPEMVLVEAPPKQMEQILYGCAQDTEAIEEVTVDPTASGMNTIPAKQRLSRYQQYSRSSGKLAVGAHYSVTPQQQSAIEVFNSVPKRPEPPFDNAEEQQQGWAARFYAEQQPVESKQLSWQYNRYRNQYFDNRSRQQAVAKGETAGVSEKLAKDKATTDQPLRVLFLLHPSTESAKK